MSRETPLDVFGSATYERSRWAARRAIRQRGWYARYSAHGEPPEEA